MISGMGLSDQANINSTPAARQRAEICDVKASIPNVHLLRHRQVCELQSVSASNSVVLNMHTASI